MKTADQHHISAEVMLTSFVVAGLAVGLVVGFVLGTQIHNIGMGLSLGALAGLIIGVAGEYFHIRPQRLTMIGPEKGLLNRVQPFFYSEQSDTA